MKINRTTFLAPPLAAGFTHAVAGKLMLDNILRSQNFLVPGAGQTGEQGGSSLVAALEVAF